MRKFVNAKANNKGADQHLCSLISAFVVHCLDSIIPLVSIPEISSLYLASMAEQACSSLSWSQASSQENCLRGLRPGKTQNGLLSYRS